jgi:hypothetical protein
VEAAFHYQRTSFCNFALSKKDTEVNAMRKTWKERIVARLRKNSLFAGLQSMTGTQLPGRWIFIVGCYNSGTTLLNQVLASHPMISGLADEGVMLTNQLRRPEDFGWRRMWWKCEDKMQVSNEARSARIIRQHWSHFYRKDASLYLEKSISNTCRMPFFEKHFDHPFFIHIVRNGYAVTEGIHRKASVMGNEELPAGSLYPVEYCARQWVRSLEVVERDSRAVKNFLEVRYEELCEDPQLTLEKICGFLQVKPLDRSLISGRFAIHENRSTISNMNSRSIKKLTADQKKIIAGIASKQLEKYHYTPDC